jgi:hypothetical protein
MLSPKDVASSLTSSPSSFCQSTADPQIGPCTRPHVVVARSDRPEHRTGSCASVYAFVQPNTKRLPKAGCFATTSSIAVRTGASLTVPVTVADQRCPIPCLTAYMTAWTRCVRLPVDGHAVHFAAISFITSISRSRSNTNFLKRAFSWVIRLSSDTWLDPILPYFRRQM